MRVLMVGAGGVGDAAARIAAERSFFDEWVVADYDLTRADRTVASVIERHPGEARFRAAQVDASDAVAVETLARQVGATHVFNAVDPRFVLPIFQGARAAGADYLDMAMSLSSRHPERALRQGRREARRRPAGAGRPVGGRGTPGPGRHRRRAGPVRRLRAVRLRPPLQPHRRARHPRRRQPRHPRRGRQRGLRPGLLDVDDHRGVPQPAGRVGEGPRGRARRRATTSRPASSPSRRSASPRSSTSPRGSAPSSACTWSTRRCSSCRAGSTPRR